MKLRFLVPPALAALCLLAAAPSAADLGGFVIRRFHADLTVESDADLLVEERIEVDFTEPRHGIYRQIPVRYTDPRGYGYSLGFRLLEVVDEAGDAHRTKLSRAGQYVDIRIGDPDETVFGRVVYRIRYRIRSGLGFFPDYDELYWNATGNEWPAAIEEATATVRLPAAVPRTDLQARAWTGPYGSRATDARIAHPQSGVVEFAANEGLPAFSGLTVSVAWPPGLVEKPGAWTRAGRFLAANWIVLAPLVAFGWLWNAYWKRGRDPRGPASVPESIMVQYEPPPGVTPGEIGALIDERVDPRDVTATVVDLAVRGHLRIRVEESTKLLGLLRSEELVFERQPPPAGNLLDFERRILDGLFASGDEVRLDDLKERFYRLLPAIHRALYKRLVEQGFFAAEPAAVRRRFVGRGLLYGMAVFLAGMAWARWQGGVMPIALLLPALAGGATFLLFAGFSRAMPQRTAKGVAQRRWALGFEEFVGRVESERLEADRRQNAFESLLPYAMALGVAATWARRFEGIYAEGSPAWYVGSQPTSGWSTRSLESNLSTAMSQTARAMASAPRSQGSSGGGGGSSGGGGGGGGGGSW